MRPIVSCINCPTYLVSKWLIKEFEKFEFPETLAVKDRYEFINTTKDLKIEDHEFMVSFDVVSLYPNVPIQESTSIINNWLKSLNIEEEVVEEYMILLKLCTSQNSFQFQDNVYSQNEGTPMGNPLSCFIANFFMSRLETQAKSLMNYFPRIWIRYVDDVFAIFDKNQNLQVFVNQLNTFHQSIKFTFEVETNNSLPYLDILLSKNMETNFIEYNIYRKDTSNYRYIPSDSYHPPQQKRAVFHSLIHRLLNTPLSIDNYNKEVHTIKDIAKFNGYQTKMIDDMIKKKKRNIQKNMRTTLYKNRVKENQQWKSATYTSYANDIHEAFKKNTNINISFSTNSNLKHLLGNPKTKLKTEDKSGIYEIPCDNCEKKYIGQTKIKIKTRFKEHLAHYKNKQSEKSAIAKHALSTGHCFSKISLLKEVSREKQLDAYESIYIHKNEQYLVNNEPGPIQNSPLFFL